jgi:hypothetical protein
MYRSTVDFEMVMPIFASSPRMWGEPQVGFADVIRRMRSRCPSRKPVWALSVTLPQVIAAESGP